MSTQDNPAVNDPVVAQDTTPTDSAPVETKQTPEKADPLLDTLKSDDDRAVIEKETTEKPDDTDTSPKDDDPKPPEGTQDTDTQPKEGEEDKPLNPKSENRFQKLANENKELRAEIERLNNEVYKPQTEQELIDEGLTPEMAEVRALKQNMELRDFNARVYETQVSLSNEAAEVIGSYDIFNPDSESFEPEIAAQAAEALSRSLIRDPNTEKLDQNGKPIPGTGQIIGYNLSPLQIYKPIADAYERAKQAGQIKGQKATDQMLSNVDAPSSAPPKETKKDPLLDILKSDD